MIFSASFEEHRCRCRSCQACKDIKVESDEAEFCYKKSLTMTSSFYNSEYDADTLRRVERCKAGENLKMYASTLMTQVEASRWFGVPASNLLFSNWLKLLQCVSRLI